MKRDRQPKPKKSPKGPRKRYRVINGTPEPRKPKGPPLYHEGTLRQGYKAATRLETDVRLHGSRSQALSRLLDGDQPWSQALQDWRNQMVQNYGGWKLMDRDPIIHELLSMCTVMKIVVDSISDWTSKNPIINLRRRALYPVVEALDKLMNSQANRLEKFALMMERQRAPIQSIEDIRSSLKEE